MIIKIIASIKNNIESPKSHICNHILRISLQNKNQSFHKPVQLYTNWQVPKLLLHHIVFGKMPQNHMEVFTYLLLVAFTSLFVFALCGFTRILLFCNVDRPLYAAFSLFSAALMHWSHRMCCGISKRIPSKTNNSAESTNNNNNNNNNER